MERPTTSASNIFRRALCPGSERMEAGLPEEDSEESKEGTLLHKHDADPSYDGAKLKQTQRDILNISEQLDHEVFHRAKDQFSIGSFPVLVFGREITMWFHRGIKALFPGTCDLTAGISSHPVRIIIDKKFGYREVTPANANLQLRAYAVMDAELHDADNVVVAITQPRLPREDRITMAVYSRDDIAAARQQLYDIWDAMKKPDAPLVASEEACRYCRARLICPEFQKMMQSGLAVVPHPNGADSLAKRQSDAERSLAQLSDVDLGRVLDAIQFADFLKDRARDVARERLAAGGMTGWKLGKEKEKRTVTDVHQAAKILKEAGIPIEKIMAACSMSLGDDGGVAEIYRELKKCTWKVAKDDISQLLGGVIEKTTMKPSVLRDVKALKA